MLDFKKSVLLRKPQICLFAGILFLLFWSSVSFFRILSAENIGSLLTVLGKSVTEESLYYYHRKLHFLLSFTGFTGGFFLLIGSLDLLLISGEKKIG